MFGGKNPNNKDPDLNDLLDKLSVLERDYDNIEKERTVYKLEASKFEKENLLLEDQFSKIAEQNEKLE